MSSSSTSSVDRSFIERAQSLLKIRSTHDRPADLQKALSFLANILAKYPDITVETFTSNGVHSLLAYYGKTRPDRFKVLFNAHVDVVAGRDEDFVPFVKDDRLYGRGALDMKVTALVMTEVFCELAGEVNYPLGLQIVTDEEIGGYDGAAYQFKQGISADFCITGEQSSNDVVVAAKGLCWLRIKQKGLVSHGAYLWKGDNALLKLTELVRKIHEVYPVPSEEVWKTTASVAQLHALTESNFNRVPDDAELMIDFRFTADDKHFVSKESVRAFIHSFDPTAEMEFVVFEQGPVIEPTHSLLTKLIEATEKHKGAPVHMIRRHANSDMRHFLSDPLMKGVEYGAGGAFEHSDGEYVDLRTVDVVRRALPDFLRSINE